MRVHSIAVVALLAFACSTLGDIDVDIIGTGDWVLSDDGNKHVTLVVLDNLTSEPDVVEFTLYAHDWEWVGDVKLISLDPDHNRVVWLRIHGRDWGGANKDEWCGPIRSIINEGVSHVWLRRARIVDRLGYSSGDDKPAISLNKIQDVAIDGDVIDDIVVTHDFLHGFVIRGDLLADVDVQQHNMDLLNVWGSIGQPGSPVQINVNKRLDKLQAGEINANITAGLGAAGELFEIVATTVNQGAGHGSGDFNGSLTTRTIDDPYHTSGLNIQGDLNADIIVDENVNEPIQIGGSLNGDITIGGNLHGVITIDDDMGLVGQIIVNADDNGSRWIEPVKVHDIGGGYIYEYTLNPDGESPYYEELKAELGGGAVGLVPFNFHKIECNPDHKQSLNQHTSPSVVTIWHYGPIYQPDSQPPLNVYRHALPLPLNPPQSELWELITDQCSFGFDYTDPEHTVTVALTAGGRFPPSYAYRFKPNGEHLKCDLGLGSSDPDVVYNEPDTDNAYQFTVGLTYDMNTSGLVDSTDLILWQADTVDLNNDALVDAKDLADLLDAIDGE